MRSDHQSKSDQLSPCRSDRIIPRKSIRGKRRSGALPYVIVEPVCPRYPTVEAGMEAAVSVLAALLRVAESEGTG